jgi:hypothetical protein
MEKLADKIANLLGETLFLYKDLQDVLEREKKHIVDMDVDSLWVTIARKRQMAVSLTALNQKMHHLLEQRALELNMDSTAFKLSDLIKRLPVSPALKSSLRKRQFALEAYKKEISIKARANKTYIDQYLSVINDIFSTVVNTVDRNQYNHSGVFSEGKEKKRLINAEV